MPDVLRDLARIAGDTLPVWRDAIVLALAGVVIAALQLYAELVRD